MLRATGTLLLVGVVFAAAVPAPKANATDRLEELVNDMAVDQQGAAAPRPRPEGGKAYIVEGGDRRRLGRCDCSGGYRNGAAAGQPVCSKRVGSGRRSTNECYPVMSNGQCSDHAAVRCSTESGPFASPAPVSLLDAEEVGEQAYLNVNLQIHNPQTGSETQLPAPDDFAAAVAQLTLTSAERVSVLTTWGAPSNVRTTTVVNQPTEAGANPLTTATVHATIATHDAERREQLVSLLQLHDELPPINGVTFRIVGVQVFEQARHPLVCTQPAESHTPDQANLLAQLVELKRQEVELMRHAVAEAQQHANTDAAWTTLLGRVATRLGMSTPEH